VTRLDPRFTALLALFFISGFAGLLYEVAWTRQLGLVFGTEALAVATVLAAYLGGLGLGAALAGPRVARIRRPLLAYAFLEAGVAVAALAVPMALHLARALLVGVLGGRPGLADAAGWGTVGFDLVTSFAILAVPTGLMGATLPLLARATVGRDAEIGARVGALYAVNTLGAVGGAAAAGFLLLPRLGLDRTVLVAVAINALVVLGALLAARSWPGDPQRARDDRSPALEDRVEAPLRPPAWILPALAVSGLTSLTYEVFWTRLLTHLLGGGVEAFSTMLASFLAGIALGAAVAAPFARDAHASRLGFAVTQIGIALFSLLSFVALNALPELTPLAQRGPWVAPGLGALALLPGAACIGATFPFAVRLLARDAAEAGPASALAYAWNTAGAILGSVGAAFVLLPRLGFEGTLTLAIGLNLLLAVVASLFERPRAMAPALVALAALALLGIAPPAPPWHLLETTPLRPSLRGPVVFTAVGQSATVLVAENEGEWSVRTNGLPEESVQPPGLPPSRHMTTRWLGVLPALLRPAGGALLMVGLGGGVAIEGVPAAIRSIDVVEIEPEVIAANRVLSERRARDPLADARVHLHVGDARAALSLTRARFDAIVSQPSHPWTASSSLYTREFFSLCREHLSEDGVFVQWIGLPFLDEELLRSLVASLGDVFPNVIAFRPPASAELLFAASERPLTLPSEAMLRSLGPELLPIGIATPEDLFAALVLDAQGSRRLADGAPLNTDARNRLETGCYRALRRGLAHAPLEGLLQQFAPLPAASLDRLRVARRLIEMGYLPRAEALGAALSGGPEQSTVQALIAVARGKSELAEALLDDALSAVPGLPEARGARLRLARVALGRGGPPPRSVVPLDAVEDAVVQGWHASDRDDVPAIAALEQRLAAADPTHPLFTEASRLRALWRIAAQDPVRAAQASDILDIVLAREPLLDDVLLRVSSSLVAGDPRAALVCLSDLSWRVLAHPQRSQLAPRVLQLLDRVPDRQDLLEWKEDVRRRLAGAGGQAGTGDGSGLGGGGSVQ
jgi:spermidine synthase